MTDYDKLVRRYNLVDMFLVFILACTFFQSVFVFGYFRANVDGESMYSTLDDGDILLLEKYDTKYERFDIVVFDLNGERLIN